MSEPVKTAEIEDVLSSIRRLVSDDHRQAAPREDVPSESVPERLVLTEALRVAEPQVRIDDVVEVEQSTIQPFVLEPAQSAPVEQVLPSESAGQDPSHDQTGDHDVIPDSADDRPQDDLTINDDLPDRAGNDELTTASSYQEMPAYQKAPDPEPTGEEVNLDAPWLDPDTTLYEAAEFATVRTSGAEGGLDQDVRPLGEKIAALEEVIARTEDQWEPDGTGLDDYAGTEVDALDWEETEEDVQDDVDVLKEDDVTIHAERIVEESLDELATEAVEDEAFAEATLDEDALRALVADIVREELQGVLGERITRNVRKLVRREIQRALAVKDLE